MSCERAWILALMNKDGGTYVFITEEIRPFTSVMQKSRPKATGFRE